MKLKYCFPVLFAIFTLFINGGYIYAQTGRTVGPLLQTKWGQGAPFGNMLPAGHRSYCGLLSMAQIMKFHNHPLRGIGQSEAYTMRNGVRIPSVNFGATIYDWSNMPNTYTANATEQQRNAAATLVYHAGAARGRDFVGGTDRNNFSYALTTFFGYDRSIQRLERRFYDDETWEAIIRRQLDSGLPVQYVGYEPGDNHAFIVDGYDNTGRFHINWGWSGSHDGWYFLNNLNYSGERRWAADQYIHINIMPDRGGVHAGYELALLDFTVDKTSIPQNELFSVSAQIRNVSSLDTFPGGQIGMALVDNSNRIITVIRAINFNALNPLSNRNITISYFIPESVTPGRYQLRMVYRLTDRDEWKIISKSAIGDGIPNAINFAITQEASITPGGGYGQRLLVFTADRLTAVRGEATQFTVTMQMRNMTTEVFSGGQYAAALMDDAGNIVSILGTGGSGGLGAGTQHVSPRNINCTVGPAVPPGRYKLRILVRQNTTDGLWRVATLSETGVPTSIDFTVR